MRPKHLTVTMLAAVGNAVCASQKPAAGGVQSLAINGILATSGVATLDVPRHFSISSSGDDNGRTFTITGTDRYGNVITEAIDGPNTTTVKGKKNFKTVTAVQVDGNTAGNITVGTADELETQWVPLERRNTGTSYGVVLSAGADLKYTIETTYSNIFASGFLEDMADAIADWTIVDMTTSNYGYCLLPTAIRLKVTNYVSGVAHFDLVQSALR